MLDRPIRFTARTVTGAGRGRRLKVPTINLRLEDAPEGLDHGVYACQVVHEGKIFASALHYGPRPVFHDGVSLEVHILDETIPTLPESLTVDVIARIRSVRNFPSAEALKGAIADDIAATRAILRA